MRRMKLVMAVLAVFLMAGIASAQTTLDFKGFIRIQPELNNFGYGWNAISSRNGDAANPINLRNDDNVSAFVDQRTRMFFNVKTGENLGGTMAFEMDTRWGDSATTVARNQGAGLGADSINIETKSLFMWYKPSNDLKLTAGLQGFSDDFLGLMFFGADMAGAKAEYTLSKESNLTVGYFLLTDTGADADTTKSDAFYFIPVTFKQKMGDATLGLSYYRLADNSATKALMNTTAVSRWTLNVLGANYAGKAGDIDYTVVGLYQFGEFADTNGDISGYALAASADMKLGAGKLRARLLYTSGDDKADKDYDGFVALSQYDPTSSIPLCCSDLQLLVRALEESINHSAPILQDAGAWGQGLTMVYASYDQNLSDKLNVAGTVAFAQLTEGTNKGIGTELNVAARYKFEKNFNVTAGAATVMLGDAFDKSSADGGKDPADPWKLFARFTYTF